MDIEGLIPPLRNLCRRQTSDPQLAEDALQRALLKVMENADKFDPKRGNLLSWANTIAVRSCYDEYRQASRLVYVDWVADGPGKEHSIEARLAAHQQVERVLRAIPQKHVDILRVVCVEEATTKEAAEIFGITPALVLVRLFRARAQFRAAAKRLEKR